MKFLITKDEHLMQGFRNKFRKPGWEEDVIKKHKFIIDYMIKNKIKYKITTGDIFDKQKSWTFKQFIANKKILEMYKNEGLEIISIAGNHDMIEGRLDIKDSPFEEMVKDELINYIGNKSLIFRNENECVEVQGIDYRYINDLYTKEDFFNEILDLHWNDDSIFRILVLHQNITPEPERVTEFTYKELSEIAQKRKINTIICGHYHIGFEPQEINNVLFINPWNLWRVVRDYNVKEELHTPEFYVLDTKNNSLERIVVPHKTYIQAFDLKEIEFYKKIKKENKHFFEFAKSFKNLSNIEDENDLQILQNFISEIKEKYNLTDNDVNKIFKELSSYFDS